MILPPVYTRTDAGLAPVVRSSDGSPRPLLDPLLNVLTIHYTGASTTYAGKDTAAVLRLLNVIFGESKPNEYNWVVDQQGAIWEYAGDYQAAHSLGNNSTAIGCLVLVGVGERPTDACVNAIRFLRYTLQLRARLTTPCQTIPHKDMGTTPTACPGAAVLARWPEIATAWWPPPPPPPPEEDDMPLPVLAYWKGKGGYIVTDMVTYWRYLSSVDEGVALVGLGRAMWGNQQSKTFGELDQTFYRNVPQI